MKQGEDRNYQIVKTNHQTNINIVVEVVRGESLGASLANYYRDKLTQEEKDSGLSYYSEPTTRPVTYISSERRPSKPNRGK